MNLCVCVCERQVHVDRPKFLLLTSLNAAANARAYGYANETLPSLLQSQEMRSLRIPHYNT